MGLRAGKAGIARAGEGKSRPRGKGRICARWRGEIAPAPPYPAARGKSRAWKSREIALARWRGKRGERGREEEGDESEHLEAAGTVCPASSVASPVPTGSARQRLCHSFGACFPPSSSPCLLFQSSSLPLFCLSSLCSAAWVVASVMHSALSFLCSFYSALLVACYLWQLWMHKSRYIFWSRTQDLLCSAFWTSPQTPARTSFSPLVPCFLCSASCARARLLRPG